MRDSQATARARKKSSSETVRRLQCETARRLQDQERNAQARRSGGCSARQPGDCKSEKEKLKRDGQAAAISVDHGSNRKPRGAVRSQTEPCATPTVRFAPRTAPRRHGSVRGGREPRRFATVRHGSPRFAKPPHGFSWFAIFFHAVFTPTETYQVSFPSRSIFAHSVF